MSDQETTLYYIVVTSFVMPILLAILLVWFFVKFQQRKNQHELDLKDAEIEKQRLELERQLALQSERSRIAAEMHDDLGGGLTSIRFQSQKMLRNLKNQENKSQLEKIVNHAQTLVGNMSEIIWAMNAGFDTLENLFAYTRRFAYEFLEEHGLELEFKTEGETGDIKLSGEKRRNLFLVIKEILHNTVKHADASAVSILFEVKDQLNITIKDNGVGMKSEGNENGNGIQNIKTRVQGLDGEVLFENDGGLAVKIKVPIQRMNV